MYSTISPKSLSSAAQIFSKTTIATGSSLRSFVMVLGASPAAFLKSALLIFLSISNFHSLLYETAIAQPPNAPMIWYKNTIIQLHIYQDTLARTCDHHSREHMYLHLFVTFTLIQLILNTQRLGHSIFSGIFQLSSSGNAIIVLTKSLLSLDKEEDCADSLSML